MRGFCVCFIGDAGCFLWFTEVLSGSVVCGGVLLSVADVGGFVLLLWVGAIGLRL